MGARRVWARGILLQCALLLVACKSFDASLLEQEPDPSGSKGVAGQAPTDAGPRGSDAGDMLKPHGTGGQNGSGGSGPATGSGGASVLTECVDNPGSKTCPMRCPETCNNEDDDCDGKIDEDAENTCELDHASATCTGGHCVIVACSKNYRDCDDDVNNGCEAPADDIANCGSCGNQCELPNAIAACKKGKCVAIGCDGLFSDCDDNASDCETAANTLDNCARCGLTCTDGDVANATASCERGFCGVGECFTGYGDCNKTPGDGCEQALDTIEHCGGCKKGCDLPGSNDDCSAGVCLAGTCEDGYDDCDGNKANGCEPLSTDANCGGCGKTCDGTLANVSSAGCEDDSCSLHCASGYDNCDTDTGTGCETLVTTRERCGDCNTPCAIKNAVVSCETGTCGVTRCEDGFDDCNDDASPDDGCETRLDTLQNCGGCGVPCDKASCSGGVCTAADCSAPPHDTDCGGTHCGNCDGDDADCEKNLDSDTQNCGTCGRACAFNNGVNGHGTLGCTPQGCRVTCGGPNFGNCNGDYRDGCETALTTLQNCHSCGTGCSIANATPTCNSNTCQVSQCAADWADCNDDKTSCETQLGTTLNCAGCAMACNLNNAVASCAGSAGSHSCAISSCTQSYFADCDSAPGNGCEIDERSSTQNCGQCGNNCSMHAHVQSATCGSGNCNYNCANGFGNCTSASGCETPLTTATDCGMCGIACARSNGSASCSTGTCTLTGCNSGYSNCDGSAANGCEPLTTLANCGACNTPCSVVNGTASCDNQTCEIGSCNSGWDDCDLDRANGCERNVKTLAMGGLGPCLPDNGCTHRTFNGRDYYFCSTDRSFSDARAHCQQQLLGELVHIDNSAENAFVQPLLAADAWIGGIDSAVEGTWRWANDDALFWTGGASGTATGYANWSSSEPNSSGNEDCAEMYLGGKWNDIPCTDLHDFVCEVQPDLCPNNPGKANPGQCGCDVADTDTDADLTSDCNDGCPMDMNKVAPGQCACGTADTDTDGDHTANCNDACPTDANKIALGACGCNVADTNTDGDSQADCNDACPLDATRTTAPCGYSYTPTNFDQTTINFGGAPTTTLDCQTTTTIDTTPGAATPFANWCGTVPTPIAGPQSGSGDAMIVPLQGLTIAAGKTLRVIGTRPLIFAVRGDVSVNGTINAKGVGATAGAGGNTACSTGKGSNGSDGSNNNNGGGGGGGGGFAVAGAKGGAGNRSNGSTAAGNAGATEGGNTLSPLRGGCNGGKGGNAGGTGGSGGAGGGALQISASGTITISANAIVTAAGGGGLNSGSRRDGGGGGGSGGAILLEAGSVNVSANAWVTANAGGGASGSSNNNNAGSAPGTDGFSNNTSAAPGGPGNSGGGNGGDGGASQGAGTGGDGQCDGICFLNLGTYGAGGGGGGGGIGRVRVHGASSCTLSGTFSPAASKACP